MNILIIKNIVLNIILITFPILVFLVISCNGNLVNKRKSNILLGITLVTSLYLCLKFGINENNNILLFCNIPIVISYLKKKSLLSTILSLINIIYCYFVYKEIFIIISIKYLSYLILYLCANKRKLSEEGFILSIGVIQGFFLSFEYFFWAANISLELLIKVIILIFIYYFLTFAILYLFRTIDRVQELNNSVKAIEKNKMIKDSLFKLTHEIKNPLSVIKGYLNMINLDNKEKAIKYVNIMKDETNRSLNIISDFLEFNKIKINKQEMDLNILLDNVYNSFKLLMKEKNIKLIYKENNDDLYINGDYDRLNQVLINLLKNSYESIDNKGQIKIESEEYDNNIDIIISDNGKGMDEENLKRVKEMFYTTKRNGTGLGVALSNEIIEAHSGRLIYESELNKGTKVIIRLPK